MYADRYDLFNRLVNCIAASVDDACIPTIDHDLKTRINGVPSVSDVHSLTGPDDVEVQQSAVH